MKLTDCELEKLLPLFMRQETDNKAIARGLDEAIRYIGKRLPLCSDWSHIDDLPEDFIDALADELDIDWYKNSEDLKVKRNLVKSSDTVHAILGTKAAVQQVVSDYYGNAVIEEWFEYEGTPGHFRVRVEEEGSKIVFPEELYKLIEKVKRASAIMDGVDFSWENYETIYTGAAVQTTPVPPAFFVAEDYEWLYPLNEFAGTGQKQTRIAPDIMEENRR